jgi:predicted aspartyl protease
MDHMLLRCVFLLFLWFLSFSVSLAQKPDLIYRRNFDRIDIPFEYENNFIIVKVIFNDIFPLRFIFDTGAEHTIITQREITDLLQVNYSRRIPIMGADMREEQYAYVASGIKMNLNGLIAPNRTILVLEEDYVQFQEFAGVNVNGILGADLFRRFVVRINYKQRMISLFDPATFKPPGGRFVKVPMLLERNKPYLFVPTQVSGEDEILCKYLIDTGAGLALLVYTNTHPNLRLPPTVVRSRLGIGLGGNIEGFVGRVGRINFAGFPMEGVITNFQDLPLTRDTTLTQNRNGIIGNQILNRFHIIFDYPRSVIYLAPTRNVNRKFSSEKSGLLLAASGKRLDTFTVYDIIAGSPAEEAGVQINDQVRSVNGWPAGLHSLEALTNKFYGKSGKKIILVIERQGLRMKIEFFLRELI